MNNIARQTLMLPVCHECGITKIEDLSSGFLEEACEIANTEIEKLNMRTRKKHNNRL